MQNQLAHPYPQFKKDDVILQVIPHLGVGGAERTTLEIATALLEAGATPLVCSGGGRLETEMKKMQIECLTWNVYTKNPLLIIINAVRLAFLIKSKGVKIIHARSRAPAWSCYLASKLTGTPYVTTFHSPYKFKSKLKLFYNSVMGRADRVIANSDYVANYVLSNYKVPESKLTRIYRGVDLDHFNPDNISDEDISALKKTWVIPEGKRIILMPARLTHWKGQTLALEALKYLTSKDWMIVFVGSDQGRKAYKQSLIERATFYGLIDQVRFIDHCANMPLAYALSDLVLSISLEAEAFGRVIVEAEAMERLVIVTENGAAHETIIDGETGYLVKSDDPKGLAARIETILSMPDDELIKKEKRARTFAASTFDIRIMCQKTLELYKTLLQK